MSRPSSPDAIEPASLTPPGLPPTELRSPPPVMVSPEHAVPAHLPGDHAFSPPAGPAIRLLPVPAVPPREEPPTPPREEPPTPPREEPPTPPPAPLSPRLGYAALLGRAFPPAAPAGIRVGHLFPGFADPQAAPPPPPPQDPQQGSRGLPRPHNR